MNSLEKHRQQIVQRMVASAGVFVIFAIFAIVAGVKGTTFEDNILLLLIGLMLGSLMILPRKTSPGRWPEPQDDEASDRLNMLQDDLKSLEARLSYMRLFYIAIATLLVVAMPLMGI
ncbi:MAG: hypothetical protein ACJAYU_005045 [Bradymonadia bacterium]|jgi:hypothetical protein